MRIPCTLYTASPTFPGCRRSAAGSGIVIPSTRWPVLRRGLLTPWLLRQDLLRVRAYGDVVSEPPNCLVALSQTVDSPMNLFSEQTLGPPFAEFYHHKEAATRDPSPLIHRHARDRSGRVSREPSPQTASSPESSLPALSRKRERPRIKARWKLPRARRLYTCMYFVGEIKHLEVEGP